AIEHAALVQAIATLEGRFPAEPDRSVAVIHAVAIALHRRTRYDLIVPLLRPHAAEQSAAAPQIAAGMTSHLRGCARAIVRKLHAACPAAPAFEAVALEPESRSALDALLERYAEVLEAAITAGLIDHQALRFPVRAACGELEAAIEKTVIPRLVARVAAAGS